MQSSSASPERITDPVTGFSYPASWIAACNDKEGLDLVRAGLAVLTSSGMILRRGYTTGTTAAACCKAATLSLKEVPDKVSVLTPSGIRVCVPVEATHGTASCFKYPGDYPGDATAGIGFIAECNPAGNGISLYPGEGIGRFARDTPRNRKGDPAISSPALSSILAAIQEGLETTGLPGVTIHLQIPRGEIVAKDTLNPKLGIEGGISILGTTGLVEPWDDHLTKTVMEWVRTSDRVVLTTGRTGLRYARLLFPGYDAVLAGSHLKEALGEAKGQVILCGLPALILKFLDPEILSRTGCETIEAFATRPEFRARMHASFLKGKERYPRLRVVIVDRNGNILGDSG
ncbi:MAG TPA: cobalt-precorrin-5B (C(1))-methyltransferase [Methanoregulaceae archaeon]|nr:cobalt-precorrin-5B (C(1))-methyltransferase [Methanoregulaceae archaeon]